MSSKKGVMFVLASPTFNTVNITTKLAHFTSKGHTIHSIKMKDIYAYYRSGSMESHEAVPESICDGRPWGNNEPAILHIRDKNQPTLTALNYYYQDNPHKINKLHAYILRKVNAMRRAVHKAPRPKTIEFRVDSFKTRAPNGSICSWIVKSKTKNHHDKSLLYPILHKIDNTSVETGYKFTDVLGIVGNKMIYNECAMVERELKTRVCELSQK